MISEECSEALKKICLRPSCEETHDAGFFRGAVMLPVEFADPRHLQEDVPAEAGTGGKVQQEQGSGVDEARHVFGPFQVAGHPVQVFCYAREHGASSRSTIQVSLLPPPWELLTTSEPGCMATRVRPPVVTCS